MTFDGCSREKWGAAVDCMLIFHSVWKRHVHVSLFQDAPLSRGDSVWWASWISEVTLISRCDILCNWQERAPYHRRETACGEINVIRVAPRPASIWQWRRKEERTQEGSDPATCAQRQDTWSSYLSLVYCSFTQLLWLFLPTRKRSLLCSLNRDGRLEPAKLCGLNLADQGTRLSSSAQSFTMWFAISTSAGLEVINLQCHVIHTAQCRPAIKCSLGKGMPPPHTHPPYDWGHLYYHHSDVSDVSYVCLSVSVHAFLCVSARCVYSCAVVSSWVATLRAKVRVVI